MIIYTQSGGVHGIDSKHQVLAIRPVEQSNYNPMCWHLLQGEILRGMVQVLIHVVGGIAWINVYKHQVKAVRV